MNFDNILIGPRVCCSKQSHPCCQHSRYLAAKHLGAVRSTLSHT